MRLRPAYRYRESLLREYCLRRSAIRARLEEFAAVPPDAYFYELAYCLCTPQSSAVNAAKAVTQLERGSFLEKGGDPAAYLHGPDYYIRFHRTKARHLLAMRAMFPQIAKAITRAPERNAGGELRAWLITHVAGLGWKEASHFLRNIGWRDLAILDRHILKNLKRHGVIRSIPHSLTAARYRTIEAAFLRMGRDLGISIDELDLLFWSRETGEILK